MNKNNSTVKIDLPPGIGAPARRALESAGYVQLEHFTRLTEAELLKLHGVGPKALEKIRQELREKGLSFSKA